MNEGWVKTYRSLTDHWVWQDKPFSKGQAWMDLLLMVNHSEKKVLIDGKLENVERGQTVSSIRKLCDRWGWSNTKVKNFLKMLENDSMIHVKSDTKKTVITIVNYGVYQDSENEKTTLKRQSNDTETTQKHTNKNEKNDKNEKKSNIKRFTPPTYEQVSGYCKERNNNVDANVFIDFYESKGWMVGKNKMKDWKAAVRNWERNRGNGAAAGREKKNPAHLDCERDHDFDSLEQQLLQKQLGDEL